VPQHLGLPFGADPGPQPLLPLDGLSTGASTVMGTWIVSQYVRQVVCDFPRLATVPAGRQPIALPCRASLHL